MRKGSFPPSRPPAATDHLTGSVTWFSTSKGFGFIKAEDGSDYFFHMSNLENIDFADLQVGLPVEFEAEPGKGNKGPRAVKVRVA